MYRNLCWMILAVNFKSLRNGYGFFSSSVHLMVRNSASATDYHLHGVSTFTVKIKRYACVCATTSDVCEAALEEVS